MSLGGALTIAFRTTGAAQKWVTPCLAMAEYTDLAVTYTKISKLMYSTWFLSKKIIVTFSHPSPRNN